MSVIDQIQKIVDMTAERMKVEAQLGKGREETFKRKNLQIQSLQDMVQGLQQELDKKEGYLKDLKNGLAWSERQRLAAEVDSLRQEICLLKESHEQEKAKLRSGYIAEIKRLESKLNSHKENFDVNKVAYDRVQQEAGALRLMNGELRQRIVSLESGGGVEGLIVENDRLIECLEDAQEVVKQQSAMIKDLKNLKEKHGNNIDDARQVIDQRNSMIRGLQKELAQFEKLEVHSYTVEGGYDCVTRTTMTFDGSVHRDQLYKKVSK